MLEVEGVFSGTLSIPNPSAQVRVLLGLQYAHHFYRDLIFLSLLALGPVAWLAFIGFRSVQPLPWHAVWSLAFLSAALWQPLFEELLFRGVIQGQMQQSIGMQQIWNGLSPANLLTSLLFTVAHLANHSIWWSLLVFVPSLFFGFVRERFGSVYPCIALHTFYNAGYFLLTGGATLLSSR